MDAPLLLSGIPTTLLDGWSHPYDDPTFYAATALEPTPAVTIGSMTIHSPEAYTQGIWVLQAGWAKYRDGALITGGSSTYYQEMPGTADPSLLLESATNGDTTYSHIVGRTMGTQYRSALVELISSIPGAGFPLSSCSAWGECSISGEPTGTICNSSEQFGTR